MTDSNIPNIQGDNGPNNQGGPKVLATASAYLLKNMLNIGSIAGTITITTTTVSFTTDAGEVIFNEPLASVQYANKLFPFAYFLIATPQKQYKFFFQSVKQINPLGAPASMVSGAQLVMLLDAAKTGQGEQ